MTADIQWVFPSGTTHATSDVAANIGPVHIGDSILLQWLPAGQNVTIDFACDEPTGTFYLAKNSYNSSPSIFQFTEGVEPSVNGANCHFAFENDPSGGNGDYFQFSTTAAATQTTWRGAAASSTATATVSTAQNSGSTTSAASVSSTSTQSAAATTQTSHSNSTAIGVGVGASIAAVAVIACIVFLLLKKRKRDNPNTPNIPGQGNASTASEARPAAGYSDTNGYLQVTEVGAQEVAGVYAQPGAYTKPSAYELPVYQKQEQRMSQRVELA